MHKYMWFSIGYLLASLVCVIYVEIHQKVIVTSTLISAAQVQCMNANSHLNKLYVTGEFECENGFKGRVKE